MFTTITTVIATLIAVSTFFVGVYQYRRSVHMNIFRTYADKYNSIVTPDIYDKWQSAIGGDQEHWNELNSQMVQYLNLIWEEFFLFKSRVIPGKLWRLWLPEIQKVLATDFAQKTMEKYHFHFPEDITKR